MVFRTNRELRQFAQLTSHDLKTPLATVVNLCDEALDEFGDDMPPQAAKLVAAAKERTFRMSRMIDEFLEVTASSDDLEANSQIDSRRVIEEVVERPATEARTAGNRVAPAGRAACGLGQPHSTARIVLQRARQCREVLR